MGRLPRRGLGSAVSADQLGPDQVPVIGAEVPATDGAGSGALDGGAQLHRDWPISTKQLAHKLRTSLEPACQHCPATNMCDSPLDRMVHAANIKHCWTSDQALADKSAGSENLAMLDSHHGTSEVLRQRFVDALEAWQAVDRKNRPQAEFARLCAKESGRPCSPQTVNSWKTTGRMDKAWLAVVEKVLGASLGFSGASPPGHPPWPFPNVDMNVVARLSRGELLELEGAMLRKLEEFERADVAQRKPAAA